MVKLRRCCRSAVTAKTPLVTRLAGSCDCCDDTGTEIYLPDAIVGEIGNVKIACVIERNMRGVVYLRGCGRASVSAESTDPGARKRTEHTGRQFKFAHPVIAVICDV